MPKRIAFVVKSTTAANWTTHNPVLLNGEIGAESDTGQMKLGDGVTAWSSLAYTKGTMPAHEWDGTSLRFENPNGSWGAWVELGEASEGVLIADNGDGTVDLTFTWTQGANSTVTTPVIREENEGVALTDNLDGTVDLTFSWLYGADTTVTTPDLRNEITGISATANLDGTLDVTFTQQYGGDEVLVTPVLQENADSVGLTDNGDGTVDLTFTFRIGGAHTVTTPDLRNTVNQATSSIDYDGANLNFDIQFDYGAVQASVPIDVDPAGTALALAIALG